jgi:hypothetical protein
MMRISCIAMALVFSLSSDAQWSFTATYENLRNDTWDEAVSVYNFARPFQQEPLPFITSGASLKMGWYKKLSAQKSLFLHPHIALSRFSSSAVTNEIETFVRLYRMDIQCDLNLSPKTLFGNVNAGPLGTRWYVTIGPLLSVWRPYTESDRRPFYDAGAGEAAPWALSWGAAAGSGYRAFFLRNRWVITPKMGVRWWRQVEVERFVEAIGGANITGIDAAARNVLVWEAGVETVWLLSRKKSSKGLAKPCPTC